MYIHSVPFYIKMRYNQQQKQAPLESFHLKIADKVEIEDLKLLKDESD